MSLREKTVNWLLLGSGKSVYERTMTGKKGKSRGSWPNHFNYAKKSPNIANDHEQSETIQNEKGEWINVYGKNTPLAGTKLPPEFFYEQDTYATEKGASGAAKRRSNDQFRRSQYGP